MSKKKNIIRVGDKVKVINPTAFIRCGYETCITDEKEKIRSEYSESIKSFLRSLDICVEPKKERYNARDLFNTIIEHERSISDYKLEIAYDRIAREVAYLKIAQDGINGNERKLYTKPMDDIEGEIFEVKKIRFVKTGIRHSSYIEQDRYSGEDEYIPGCLEGEKTHKILTLGYINPFMIEASNVEKVNETKQLFNYDRTKVDNALEALEKYHNDWKEYVQKA